ncbi:MAG: hypothetical protein NZZ41_00745 [Candidatus Dojkabacteria bacterium]|nr:hypothetical protein [Candidatus Dojkabacteria bacterium]
MTNLVCTALTCFSLVLGIVDKNSIINEASIEVFKDEKTCTNILNEEKNKIINLMIEELGNNDPDFIRKYRNFLNKNLFLGCVKYDQNFYKINKDDKESYIGMLNRNLLLKFYKK